jgi:hypothetical protein
MVAVVGALCRQVAVAQIVLNGMFLCRCLCSVYLLLLEVKAVGSGQERRMFLCV